MRRFVDSRKPEPILIKSSLLLYVDFQFNLPNLRALSHTTANYSLFHTERFRVILIESRSSK